MAQPFQTRMHSMPIIKEGVGYGMAGVAQLAIDWLIFVFLSHFGLFVVAGNLIARVAGACIGFWLNRNWTFRTKPYDSMNQHVARFAVWWLISTLVSTGIVQIANHLYGLQSAWMAKPAIDALLAGCGFLVSKFWIYR